MGAGCTQAPIDPMDTQHAEMEHSTLQHLIIDNPNSIETIETNPKFKVNQCDHINSPKSISSHNSKSLTHRYPKSKKTKKQIPHKRRRKTIRNKSFDMSPDTNEYKLSNPIETSNKSSFNLLYELEFDYNMPYLPIRFTNSTEIWNKEFQLFINRLTKIVYNTDTNSNINIIKTILEFAEFDSVYKLHHNFPINNGLWPQEYILNISETNINENSMIINDIRDALIHSFNLQNIFETCGNCFQYKTSNKMDNFFINGVYKQDKDLYINNAWNNIISEYEPNDGYTSTASSITNIINPLKFKIYSHDIMICPKGFYIERHNEYYEQSQHIINDKNIQKTDNYNNSELLYYFTLLLLPPNIQTYKGGKYKFYNVENNFKYIIDSRNCTPISNINNNKISEYIEITSDKYYWTWILFDKRVEYECDPILNGSAITFKMDIDVWRKSIKEIKQNEESYERINQLLSGQLNININDKQIDYDSESIDLELSQSPNIVFPPYAIKWGNL
eukprot:537234_1